MKLFSTKSECCVHFLEGTLQDLSQPMSEIENVTFCSQSTCFFAPPPQFQLLSNIVKILWIFFTRCQRDVQNICK